MMLSDSYYAIGKSHIYCQDFAHAESSLGGRAYAVVADGCSSSPNTDIGARLLALTAIEKIYDSILLDPEDLAIPNVLIARIMNTVEDRLSDFLSPSSLDATLLLAFEWMDGIVQVMAMGDGVILARKNGQIETWEINFGGAPAYPSYMLSRSKYKRYIEEGFGKRTVVHKMNGVEIDREETSLCFEENPIPDSFVYSRSFNYFEYDLVMLLTDGALSFQSTDDLRSISLEEIIPYITDFQVKTAGFLVRSHLHFLNKVCKRLGWQHTDDFGSAALLRKE